MLAHASFAHAKKKYIAGLKQITLLLEKRCLCSVKQLFGMAHLGPAFRVRRRGLQRPTTDFSKNTADQAKAISSYTAYAPLMVIRCPNPPPGCDDGQLSTVQSLPPSFWPPAFGYVRSQSSPGIVGKPRKLTKLSNLRRHVSLNLSQPT